jgi:hypothetical protein
VAHARDIRGFASGRHGKRVSKGALLGVSQPFHCWFCCPGFLVRYLNGFLKAFARESRSIQTSHLPPYAQALLPDAQGADHSPTATIRGFEGLYARRIGVYDLRGVEERFPDLE